MRAWMLLPLSMALPIPALASPGPVDGAGDPVAAIRRAQAAPLRYGGSVQGLPVGDGRVLHLSLGLDAVRPDGALTGEAILFDADRRLVAAAAVTGQVAPAAIGPAPCRLRFGFPAGPTELRGTCDTGTVAGELRSDPNPPGLLMRLVSWWGDRGATGRAWLDAASFDPQP